MSTIFGIFQLNSEPIDPLEIGRMKETMNHWQADSEGVYTDKEVMLGHLLLYNTPESINEKQPFETESSVISANARIDNRAEILKLLSEYRFLTDATPDAVLISFLYEKFEERCVDYLLGDFAFVIWNKKKRQLFCARDQMGIKPFFYFYTNNFFAFASEKKGLLALQKVNKKINFDFVYKLLADIDTLPTENFHEEIHLLFAAHYLKVDSKEMLIKKYWQIENPPIIKLASNNDYIEGFREQLLQAVNCRLRTAFPIAVELSGGLDSSGVLGMANKLIKDKNRLFTFSNVLDEKVKGNNTNLDEEKSIDEILQFNHIKNSIKVSSSGLTDLFAPHKKDLFVNSGVEMYSAYWQEPIRNKMTENGCRVTLSGFFGDEAVSNRGTYYYYGYLDEKAYWDFIKSAFQHKQYTLPVKMLVRHLVPQKWQYLINKDKNSILTRNSYLLDKEIEERLVNENPNLSINSTRSYKQLILEHISRKQVSRRTLNEANFGILHRLEPRYPFADLRLLSYFLSMPTSVLGHPTIKRYFFKQAMKDFIPDSVRLQEKKILAAGIFITPENRELANDLYSWLSNIYDNLPHDIILEKIDFNKILDGLDNKNPKNYENNEFKPVRPYRVELLIYYFLELLKMDHLIKESKP